MKRTMMAYLRKLFSFEDGEAGPLVKDRYKGLQVKLFILIGTLAVVPLALVSILSFFWMQGAMKEDFNNQLRGNIDSTRQAIEFFIEERIAGLRFLAAADSLGRLTDPTNLDEIFAKFKREFGEVVDLGLIDSRGVQLTYSGPYDLRGRNYSNQDWFNEVAVRGVYVSDVFMGYRKIPHFAIAVKKEVPGQKTFWILRATIDMSTLNRYISTINLKSRDDAFIINKNGIMQTQSRYHGNVLEKINMEVPHPNETVTLVEVPQGGSQMIFGYTSIKNSPWIMGVTVSSTASSKLLGLLTGDIAAIYFAVFLVVLGIIANIRITAMVVNWIREAEMEREEAIAQTQHAGKLASIGRLGAGVAHEINNPLAIINEKAGLMKDILMMSEDSRIDKAKFLSLIQAVSDSVNRCKTITQRLLGFARRMDVRHEEIDLNDTIREVIEFLDKEILYRNINLETRLKEGMPRVISDKGQLQQVFLNIINNAIDAVADGGLIVVSTEMLGHDRIRVAIKDNGEGIPKEKIKNIFEPFYTTKAKGKGTGLGLSISYGIIDRLGGTIQVESEVGTGTTFHVELPIRAEAQ